MLKSLNFTVIKCTECNETIKIQPSVAFESITHECKTAKKAPTKDTATTSETKAKKAPVKKSAPKKA